MHDADIFFRAPDGPIPFGRTFVASDAFRALFREGMGLVEETAAYLDGPGRDASRHLGRHGALTYASESMRLTTRLMQIASWLLVHRAVAEGEITPAQALQEKNRVRLTTQEGTDHRSDVEALPAPLRALVDLSFRLHARIVHLDAFTSHESGAPAARESPANAQQRLLRSAFSRAS